MFKGERTGMIDSLSIALSGLNAQKLRLNASASNIANLSTGGAPPGAAAGARTVYLPLRVDLAAQEGGGVLGTIVQDGDGYSLSYDPSSALADDKGYVAVPNVDLATEAVNVAITKSAYKANAAVIKTQGEMTEALLDALV